MVRYSTTRIPWLAALILLAASLTAFAVSLQVRYQDWNNTRPPAGFLSL